MRDPDTIPDPMRFEIVGIKTRPHEQTRVPSYLVYIASLYVWMPVRDALRNGVVPLPPPLPSGSYASPVDSDRKASDKRAHELWRDNQASKP